jgi:hypothetical protein
VFPADPPGRWDQPSVSDMVHGTAALVAFAAFPVAALMLSRAVPRGRPVAIGSAALTVAFAVFLADVMDGPSLGAGGAPTLLGLVERVLIAVNLTWLWLAAPGRSRAVSPRRPARGRPRTHRTASSAPRSRSGPGLSGRRRGATSPPAG